MKTRLLALIDALNESQILYAFAFLSRMFGKAGE